MTDLFLLLLTAVKLLFRKVSLSQFSKERVVLLYLSAYMSKYLTAFWLNIIWCCKTVIFPKCCFKICWWYYCLKKRFLFYFIFFLQIIWIFTTKSLFSKVIQAKNNQEYLFVTKKLIVKLFYNQINFSLVDGNSQAANKKKL